MKRGYRSKNNWWERRKEKERKWRKIRKKEIKENEGDNWNDC